MFGRGTPDQKLPGTSPLGAATSTSFPQRDLGSGAPMVSPAKAASIIGPDLAIVGHKITLVSKSALVIAGEVSGDIHGDDVTIAETGKVTGTVSGRSLSIHGEVHGSLRGETVALYSTARIDGEIVQKNLVIAEGAQFDGRVRAAREPADWEPVLDADAHRPPPEA